MSDTSGPMYETPLARYDLDTRSWRTCSDTSLWDLPMSSLTLPQWGMTRGGVLFERPTPALPTPGSECSSSLLKTPVASERTHGRPARFHSRNKPEGRFDLSDQVAALLPTPTVMDMGANYTPEEWAAWKDKQRAVHKNGNGHGASLTQEALALLPTPTATDHKSSSGRNPEWGHGVTLTDAARSVGVITGPLSPDGSTSSDDPHPPLPFPDEETDLDSTHSSWNG